MNVEVERLGTFREWPANAAVDAARLARAGFYYTGNDLEVECFLCGTKISDWNYSDQAMARHREKAPDCPFVVNPTSTCNVPLIPTASRDIATTTTTTTTTMTTTMTTTTTTTTTDTWQRNDVGNDPCDARKRNPLKEYRTVSQRLRSFSSWPITSVVHPERLAAAGFYYLQYHDMVECAFCRGILMNWKAGDDPDCEHRLSFPNCDFYLREDIDDDTLGLVRVSSGTTDVTELGIQKHRAPCRPQYATYERRLQTFTDWPDNLRQTPKMLAAAGFYYVGCNDQVRCFHCDGGLREWQPTDDVWVEHAQWFPTCGFVNLLRGPKFIRHCVNNRTSMNLSVFTTMLEDTDVTGTSLASLYTVTQPGKPVTDTAVSTAETWVASPSTVLQPNEPVTDTTIPAADITEPSVVWCVSAFLRPSEPATEAAAPVADVTETSVASLSTVVQPNEPMIDTVISVADIAESSSSSLSTVAQPNEPVANTMTSVIDVSESSVASLSAVSQPNKPITDVEVEKLLHTAVAKAALEIGLHEGRVKRALKRRMGEVGKPYTNTVQLIQDVLHDQILEEDNRFDNDNFQTSELTNLFDYLNVTNNYANRNSTQESDASENKFERETDNDESDDIMFLREENRKLKESRLCKVCMDSELAIVFLPCGHLATCNNCAPALATCPLCRLKIEAYIRIFFS